MDQPWFRTLGHVSDFIELNEKACTARYRKNTPLTITVDSSVYPIETFYADFYERSEDAINKISPDFLKKVSRKDLNVYTFNELVKKIVKYRIQKNIENPLLSIPTLDPKEKILKNCPIHYLKDYVDYTYAFSTFLRDIRAGIIVSSLKKGKNLDNALIGVYRIGWQENQISGLMIFRLIDLEYYNGNPEQIVNHNEILGLARLLELFPESHEYFQKQ